MAENLFGSVIPNASANDANSPRVLGCDFTVAQPGLLSALLYYVIGPAKPTTVKIDLWEAAVSTAVSIVEVSGSPAVIGWLRLPLTTPQLVLPGHTYTVAAWISLSGAIQPDYGFTNGGLSANVVSGNLTALANTGRFLNNSATPAYPNGGSGVFNFFADVEYTATGGGGSPYGGDDGLQGYHLEDW